jgi:hypothetical protein
MRSEVLANLVLFLLDGFGAVAVLFLLMAAMQLFKIEKALGEVTLLAEHRIKKLYAGKASGASRAKSLFRY